MVADYALCPHVHGPIQTLEGSDHHRFRERLAEGMHIYGGDLPRIFSEMSLKSDASESLIGTCYCCGS